MLLDRRGVAIYTGKRTAASRSERTKWEASGYGWWSWGAIISESWEAVEKPSAWEDECNLRVKRQDPLPKANDRWRKQSMPTLGYRNGRRVLNRYRSVFGLWVSADKRKTGQRSLTQQRASVRNWYQVPLWDRNVSQSFLRYDAASGNWQPTITRRVMRRPMPVNRGKRAWRAPIPHLFIKSSDSIIGYWRVRDSETNHGLFLYLDFCATLGLKARQRRLLCQRARHLQLLRHQMNRPQGSIEGQHFESKDRATG